MLLDQSGIAKFPTSKLFPTYFEFIHVNRSDVSLRSFLHLAKSFVLGSENFGRSLEVMNLVNVDNKPVVQLLHPVLLSHLHLLDVTGPKKSTLLECINAKIIILLTHEFTMT